MEVLSAAHLDSWLQVFQRQLSKEGLQQVVNSNAASAEGDQGGGLSASAMSSDELRDLFTLRTLTLSDTYDSMCAGDDSDVDVDVDGLEEGPARQEPICRQQACPALFVGPLGTSDMVVQGTESCVRNLEHHTSLLHTKRHCVIDAS